MKELIWIGARESDKEYTKNFFSGSVTLYGGRKKENKAFCLTKDYRINHNNITNEQTEFMVKNELRLIEKNPNVEFMSYNPNLLYGCNEEVIRHTVCLNDEVLMNFLDSKRSFRKFAGEYVTILHSQKIRGDECRVTMLEKRFPGHNRWIVQSDIASGGYRTFVMDENSEKDVEKILHSDEEYLVSPYYEINIPINIHAIIYERDILLTPGSVQIMGLDKDRMLYRGADYIAYKDIPAHITSQFVSDIRLLCKKIQKLGYRGIIGIDAIIVDGTALILEVNNRFQASTILLNKALEENGLPSMHELNYEAFKVPTSHLIKPEQLETLSVPYSIYAYIQNDHQYHVKNILNKYINEKTFVEYIDDGYISWQDAEDEAYLCRIIFNTNIVSLTAEGGTRLHPNVKEPENTWYRAIIGKHKDYKRLKISLINQGVILSEDVKEYLEKNGGMREGVYYAVDLTIDKHYIVNSPLYVKLVSLSPFSIQMEKGELYLYYYDNKISSVEIDFSDKIAEQYTNRGVPVGKICLLATDRLRVQNSDFCVFKENNIPCRFCEAPYKNCSFELQDICDALDCYLDKEEKGFRHILIGGLSNRIGREKNNIEGIIKHIRKYTNMSIYLMTLPCRDTKDIEDYVRLGVNEIGFNIEIFDRALAEKYMPGKGKISLDQYKAALEKAVSLLGRKGAVRSAFIVGLESKESLLKGVEYVCKLGVAPILSVFRPIPCTDMENLIPPDNEWLLDVYNEVEKVCSRYGLKPGPTCSYCQNNTLAFDILESRR